MDAVANENSTGIGGKAVSEISYIGEYYEGF